MSPTDIARVKQLESQAESARDANERLLQQMRDRDDELARMKKRENWLVAEVILARQNGSSAAGCSDQAVHMNNKRLSMADLEKDLENQQLQGHQLMITRALVKVKEDLRHAKVNFGLWRECVYECGFFFFQLISCVKLRFCGTHNFANYII